MAAIRQLHGPAALTLLPTGRYFSIQCSPITEKKDMGGACSTYGVGRGAHRVLVEKPEGRPRRRWEDNITMDLQEVECGGMNWIDLAHDNRDRWQALVNSNLRVP
jgi:hypothetical protein